MCKTEAEIKNYKKLFFGFKRGEMMYINVIGAGLAGCECAYQIAKRGINVRLFEMKPTKKTAAHKSDLFCELICSNSLKALRIESAAGLLKEEMRRLDSLLMRCADKCAVPAGGALAVNRDDFSAMVTKEIRNNPLIEVIEKEVTEIPNDGERNLIGRIKDEDLGLLDFIQPGQHFKFIK